MVEHEPSNRINSLQDRGRAFAMRHKDFLLPTDVEHVSDGLERTKFLFRNGYSAIPMTTHPTKPDEAHEYPILWAEGEFANTIIVVPTAYDQCTPALRIIAESTGVRIRPVVTQEVINRGGDKGLPRGYGNMGYFREAIRTTGDPKDPGIVFLAPSAGRSPSLITPDTRAAEFLLTATKDANIVVLFMGVEVNGVTDYNKIHGYNIGKRYTIRIGNASTNEKILKVLPEFREEHGIPNVRPDRRPFFGVEQWMYETQFPDLVPETYKNSQVLPSR